MDGCTGTLTDQYRSETSISIAEAQHTDNIVGGAGLAVATIVAAPLAAEVVTYAAIPMANLCLANPMACSEITVGAAVTAAELIGDVSLGLDPGETGSKTGVIVNACKKASELWDYINE